MSTSLSAVIHGRAATNNALLPPNKSLVLKRLFKMVVLVLALAAVLGTAALVTRPFPAAAAQASQVIVRAHGISGEEQMVLTVNGSEVERWTVSTSFSDYVYNAGETISVDTVEVSFVNDLGFSRDLTVDYIDVGGIVLEAESPSTVSTGTYLRGTGCVERSSVSELLHCEGSFHFAVPASTSVQASSPETSDHVIVRAFARIGGEQIAVRINGEDIVTEILTQGWHDLSADLPTDTIITDAEVHFLNDDGPRDLRIDYLEVDGQAFESESLSTRADGTFASGYCNEGQSFSEWLHCDGFFRYDVNNTAAVSQPDEIAQAEAEEPTSIALAEETNPTPQAAPVETIDRIAVAPTDVASTEAAPTSTAPGTSAPSTTSTPTTSTSTTSTTSTSTTTSTTTTTTSTTTTTAPAPAQPATAALASSGGGRYSIAQVIDSTIGAGDGSNPNEESPMGRHDAPLSLNQGWNWAQGPTRNSVWGQLGSGGSQFAEFRCAVIPELGHTPSVPFRINVREGAYYQFANNSWQKGFDVDLTGGNHGGYLGTAGSNAGNPFNSGSHGLIDWRREADGSFSAPWNPNALMMHFWAAQREAPASGQTAEFLTSEVRLQQPDGQTVDLGSVNVLFQCGVDYYSTTGGQGTQVPGPGIGKYHRVTESWAPSLWVTLPNGTPANSVSDFSNWLSSNPPPNVG